MFFFMFLMIYYLRGGRAGTGRGVHAGMRWRIWGLVLIRGRVMRMRYVRVCAVRLSSALLWSALVRLGPGWAGWNGTGRDELGLD